MTPEQAIALLDSIVSQVPMKRDDHGKAIEALKVLRSLKSVLPASTDP